MIEIACCVAYNMRPLAIGKRQASIMLEALRALIHSHRRDALTLLLLLVIGSGLFAPMMHHWRLMGDYTVHNNLAYGLTENGGEFFRNTPHFLYHVLTAA